MGMDLHGIVEVLKEGVWTPKIEIHPYKDDISFEMQIASSGTCESMMVRRDYMLYYLLSNFYRCQINAPTISGYERGLPLDCSDIAFDKTIGKEYIHLQNWIFLEEVLEFAFWNQPFNYEDGFIITCLDNGIRTWEDAPLNFDVFVLYHPIDKYKEVKSLEMFHTQSEFIKTIREQLKEMNIKTNKKKELEEWDKVDKKIKLECFMDHLGIRTLACHIDEDFWNLIEKCKELRKEYPVRIITWIY